jgi:hypothetical protein
MQEVRAMLDSNHVAGAELFEPRQPDVTPRSYVVVPHRECDRAGVKLSHGMLLRITSSGVELLPRHNILNCVPDDL